MKFCVIKDEYGCFLGKEYDEGYYYSEWTNESASLDPVWSSLESFLGHENVGITIFESHQKAAAYMAAKEKDREYEIINIKDLDAYREVEDAEPNDESTKYEPYRDCWELNKAMVMIKSPDEIYKQTNVVPVMDESILKLVGEVVEVTLMTNGEARTADGKRLERYEYEILEEL